MRANAALSVAYLNVKITYTQLLAFPSKYVDNRILNFNLLSLSPPSPQALSGSLRLPLRDSQELSQELSRRRRRRTIITLLILFLHYLCL